MYPRTYLNLDGDKVTVYCWKGCKQPCNPAVPEVTHSHGCNAEPGNIVRNLTTGEVGIVHRKTDSGQLSCAQRAHTQPCFVWDIFDVEIVGLI